MNNNFKAIKLASGIFLAMTASLATNSALATTANGNASITLSQSALATLKGTAAATNNAADIDGKRTLYVNEFFNDSEFQYVTPASCSNASVAPALCNLSPTNHAGLATDTQPYSLPVVPSDGTGYQAGNIQTNWTSTTGGSIGLAGAFKIRSAFQNPTLSIRWGELSLENTGSTWTLNDNLNGGSIFELVNVATSTDAHDHLILSADLKFGSSDWAGFLGALVSKNTDTVVGHIDITPAAVPVPAAVWLFGSAILGMAGFKRRNTLAA